MNLASNSNKKSCNLLAKSIDVRDKKIVVDDQVKILKISHTFSSGREKYVEGIIGIIIIIIINVIIIRY